MALESPFVVGATVAVAAYGSKLLITAWRAFKARPNIRRFYPGGFQQTMNKREAALILGIRQSAVVAKVKEAHRRAMVANHPDSGGSNYLANKINEAKNVMAHQTSASGSVF